MKFRELVLAALLVVAPWAVGNTSYDVLELPAVKSDRATETLIYSIRKFGDRYFATGHFGHILYSDDGKTWTQADVPVRSSITDIDFPTPELGWAVGHEGVILHSSDGGKSWVKQYDGLRYGTEGLAYYTELTQTNPENDYFPWLVEEMEFAISQGADKPLFRVGFHSPTHGHALGAYGMILRTEDGGENWEHVLHNMENDSFMHIFDFSQLPEEGKYFISGEAGLFMVGDINAQTGTRIHSIPWEGSFFTSTDTAKGNIVMGGLRGRMFHTTDVGATWTVVEKPVTSAIVDSTRLADGRIVAVGIGGSILISNDDGLSFDLVQRHDSHIYAVQEGPGDTLLLGGPHGIQTIELPR